MFYDTSFLSLYVIKFIFKSVFSGPEELCPKGRDSGFTEEVKGDSVDVESVVFPSSVLPTSVLLGKSSPELTRCIVKTSIG